MLVPGAVAGLPVPRLNATVKILDIGLVAFFDENTQRRARTPISRPTGAILGTPDYMAPEQARDSHTADIRSDIYSLGCTLFHALAGQRPSPIPTWSARSCARYRAGSGLEEVQPSCSGRFAADRQLHDGEGPRAGVSDARATAQAMQVFLVAGSEAAPAGQPRNARSLDWLESSSGEGSGFYPVGRPAAAAQGAPATPVAVAAPLLPVRAPTAVSNSSAITPKKEHPSLDWSARRLMLWVGAGFLAVAGGVGLILKRVLARKKLRREPGEG